MPDMTVKSQAILLFYDHIILYKNFITSKENSVLKLLHVALFRLMSVFSPYKYDFSESARVRGIRAGGGVVQEAVRFPVPVHVHVRNY